ncbi:hypothetical protein BGZ83_008486 [Gryganskiella cystojenkinii]|nr:hypothetical protein BGZ83_008486 [Gryganskiella cystojenkinii]
MATGKPSPLLVKISIPQSYPPAPTFSSSTLTTTSQLNSASSTPPTASTPTSGMHSPPLSASAGEDGSDTEMTIAQTLTATTNTTPAVTLTTASPAMSFTSANQHNVVGHNSVGSSNVAGKNHSAAHNQAEIPSLQTTAPTVIQSAGSGSVIDRVVPTTTTARATGGSSTASTAAAAASSSSTLPTTTTTTTLLETTSKLEPKSPTLPVLTKSESSASESGASAMDEDLLSQQSNASSQSDDSGKENDLKRLQRHQDKQKAIDNVIQRGKILKVSRRLRTRLEYAILKIRRGWSKYTLQEVESLLQPACSPIIAGRKLHGTSSAHNSPRQAERKRIRKLYPSYEETSVHHHHRSSSDPAQLEMDAQMEQAHAGYRSRLPSFSQYKDSELFLPAKSLMEIATSKPEPGYVSPYHSPSQSRYATPEPLYRDATPAKEQSPGHWSTYSSPQTPSAVTFEEEEQGENGVIPSAAQAARTILMLSSPTRPPPRTLNQNYILEMNSGSPTTAPLGGEWTAPYSPATSSPLVQFQTNASSNSPSPDRSPSLQHYHSGSTTSSMDVERATSGATTPKAGERSPYPSGSGSSSSRPMKQTFSNLYGMGHGPSSPSPLSTSLFPSSHDSHQSHSRSSSPTLIRAARFAAAAIANNSAGGGQETKETRSEYNNTAEQVYPEWQQARDDKQDQSMDVQYSSSPLASSQSHYQRQDYRARTPPSQTQSYGSSGPSHGMRTPPPSGGKELAHVHYSAAAGGSIPPGVPMRRRDSGLIVPHGKTSDLTTLLRPSHNSQSNSRATSATGSPNPGSGSSPYHRS